MRALKQLLKFVICCDFGRVIMFFYRFGKFGGMMMNKMKAAHQTHEKDPKLIETWDDLLAVQTTQGAGSHRLSINMGKNKLIAKNGESILTKT